MTALPAKLLAATAALTLLTASPSRAVPREVEAALGDASALGQASYRWLGLPVYEATLYVSGPGGFDWQKPLALELVYARSLSGSVLLDSTLSEFDRIEGEQPDHPEIRSKLARCFQDVDTGDRYVAISAAADGISFWLNGQETCEISHPGAKARILGIWLSDESRAEVNARALRGE